MKWAALGSKIQLASLIAGCTFLGGWAQPALALTPQGMRSASSITALAMLAVDTPPARPKSFYTPSTPIRTASSVGYLPSSWDITPSGELNYSIPLDVPAGVAGMQPSLSLNFSSNSGNGMVGVGWSVSGFSSITRCGDRFAIDNNNSGAKLSEHVEPDGPPNADGLVTAGQRRDNYCLDGQRLIAITGSYGDNGTVYRTENDSFSRVQQLSTAAEGPGLFKVYTKDGLIKQYESFNTSRTAWRLSQVADRSGNIIRYEYTQEVITGTGSRNVLPYRISWSSDGTNHGFRRYVQFDYEDRPDISTTYSNGIETVISKRLKTISMHAPMQMSEIVPIGTDASSAWQYNLVYKVNVSGERSLLGGVQRCGALGGCLWQKQFQWDGGRYEPHFGTEDLGNYALATDQTVPAAMHIADFDHDGAADILLQAGGATINDASQTKRLYSSSRNAQGTLVPLSAVSYSPFGLQDINLAKSRTLDLDADGASELLAFKTAPCRDQLLTVHGDPGSYSFAEGTVRFTKDWGSCPRADYMRELDFIDFNGDGLLDVTYPTTLPTAPLSADAPPYLTHFAIQYNQSNVDAVNPFAPPIVAQPTLPMCNGDRYGYQCPPLIFDKDGDGRQEMLRSSEFVTVPTDGGEFQRPWAVATTNRTLGQTDFGNISLSLPAPIDNSGPFGEMGQCDRGGVMFGDFNGDGLTDIVQALSTFFCDPAHGVITTLNDGIGFGARQVWTSFPGPLTYDVSHSAPDKGLRIADFNSDGMDDILVLHEGGDRPRGIGLFLSNGDGTFGVAIHVGNDTGAPLIDHYEPVELGIDPGVRASDGSGWTTTRIGDFDADGLVDIVTIENGNRLVLHRQQVLQAPLLTRVYDEDTAWPRETFVYAQQWASKPRLENPRCSYPQRCSKPGSITVVREVQSRAHLVDASTADISNDSKVRRLHYSYADPRSDVRGRGFLGFGTFRMWDPQVPMETVTTYRNDYSTGNGTPGNMVYPYAGRPRTVTTVVPIVTEAQRATHPAAAKARVSMTVYTDQYKTLNGGKTYIVQPSSSTSFEWEQNSVNIDWNLSNAGNATSNHIWNVTKPQTPERRVDVTTNFDDPGNYGNLTGMTRTTAGGVKEEITFTYDYIGTRVYDWLISLPLTTTIKSTARNNETKTRHLTFEHDSKGRRTKTWVEKDEVNADILALTTIGYDDATGVVTSIKQESAVGAGVPAREIRIEYTPLRGYIPNEKIYASQIWAVHSNADPACSTKDCRPSSWQLVHPAYGVTVATMDVNGTQTFMRYDDLGRVVNVEPAGSEQVNVSYSGRPDLHYYPSGAPDDNGMNGLIVETTRGTELSRIKTDGMGRLIRRSTLGFDGTTLSTAWTAYDLLGRVRAQSLPYVEVAPGVVQPITQTTTFSYDSLNRLLESTRPDGSTTTQWYTFFEIHTKDAGNNGVQNEHYVVSDKDGRIMNSVDVGAKKNPDGSVADVRTLYDYGPFDTLKLVEDDVSNRVTMSYDIRGRRTQIVDPDTGTTESYYNGFGDTRKQVRVHAVASKSLITETSFDDLGRMLSRVDSSGGTVKGTNTFAYDTSVNGVGQLATTKSVVGASAQVSTLHDYDSYGRAVRTKYVDEIAAQNFSIDLGYDAVTGRLDTVAYPEVNDRKRFTAKYSYSNGSVSEIGEATPDRAYKRLWTVDARNLDMSLAGGTLGNDIQVTRAYDPQTLRLTGIAAAPKAGGAKVVDLGYEYWPNGLVKRRNDSSVNHRDERFDYDALARLTAWTLKRDGAADRVMGYSYDSIGNLTGVTKNSVQVERNTYGNAGAQPHTLTNNEVNPDGTGWSSRLHSYDTWGRQTAGGGRSIVNMPFDLPKTVSKDGKTWNFNYDAFGQRFKKYETNEAITYIGGLYEKRVVGGATKHVFNVTGTDGAAVTQLTYTPPVAPATTGTDIYEYVVNDALGSASTQLSATGAATYSFFEPFGKRINSDGSNFTGAVGNIKEGFTGHEHEDALGLINMKGRMYDPLLKRFLSADPHVTVPLSGQSWNPYSYVLNSPLNFTDPTGFDCSSRPGADLPCTPVPGEERPHEPGSSGCEHGGPECNSLGEPGLGGAENWGGSGGCDGCRPEEPAAPPRPRGHGEGSNFGGSVSGKNSLPTIVDDENTAAYLASLEIAVVKSERLIVLTAGLAAAGIASFTPASKVVGTPSDYFAGFIGAVTRQLANNGSVTNWDMEALTVDIYIGALGSKYVSGVLKANPVFGVGGGGAASFLKQQALIMPAVSGLAAIRAFVLGKDVEKNVKSGLYGSVHSAYRSVGGQLFLSTPMGRSLFPAGVQDGRWKAVDQVIGRVQAYVNERINPTN